MIGQCIIWYDIVLRLDTILSYDMNRKGIMIWCFIIYLTIYQLIHTISFLILQLYHFMIQIWNNITIHDSTSYHKYMIQYTIILYNIVASFHIVIWYNIGSYHLMQYCINTISYIWSSIITNLLLNCREIMHIPYIVSTKYTSPWAL